MAHLLRSQGIKHQWSSPHTHEQNGIAERFHRWMGESLATLFADAPWVPVTLWPQAIMHLALCFNLHPRVHKDLRVSPYELFYQVKPSFKKFMLLPWGTPVLFVVPKSGRMWKGADHSSEGMYMGPSLQAKEAIRVYHVKTGIIITTYSWHEMPCPPHTWPKFSQSGTIFINQQEEAPAMPLPVEIESSSNFTFDELDSPLPVIPPSVSDAAIISAGIMADTSALQGREATPVTEPDILVTEPPVSAIEPIVIVPVPAIQAEQTAFLEEVGRRASTRFGTGLTGHLAKVIARICVVNLNRERAIRRVKERSENMPSMKQALASPEREEWKQAINMELEQMVLLDVLEDPVGPIDKVVETMMILKKVVDANGIPVKFKARLVAVGSRQPVGTFGYCGSATSRNVTVKTFVSGGAARGKKVVGYDVPGAYLQANTADASTTDGDPNIVVRMPDGSFKKLKKFLYGLKQSGAEWFDRYSKFLISLGYDRSETEPCLWMWRENREAIFGQPLATNERYHLVCVFVDDNLAYGNCDVARDFFESEFKREFGECKRKEGIFTFLGMLVDCQGEDIVISMPNYAEKVVLAGGINSSKTSTIPGISRWSDKNTEVDPADLEPADREEYMRLMGVINFFAITLRFDLLNCVSRLSQYLQAPLVCHMKQLRKICAYVNGSKDVVLTYRRSKDFKLRGFVDASHDSNAIDSTGQSGSALFFGENSGAISAQSKKQKDIGMSSAEAETSSLLELQREVVWVKEILQDMGFDMEGPVEIYEDNAATFVYGQGGGNYGRTKHMRRKIANVAAYIKMGLVVMIKVDSASNIADMMTKQGLVSSFLFLRQGLFNGPFIC
jgi:histone deacetylase 1/2